MSQRAAAAALGLAAPRLPLGLPSPEAVPTPNTGRMWLLRLGLYELTRPKERADDWVWIMDHTIQLGSWKCFLIVGARLSAWEPQRGPLEHGDLALLNVTPMEHATGEAVEEQLRATAQQTGAPRAVVSDGAAELKSGMELFCKDHGEVAHVRDIKHKGATLLKRHLEGDPRWAEFVTQSTQTKRRVTQTPLAYLVPPALKAKARYMNLDTLVRWGREALGYLEAPREVCGHPLDRNLLEKKLGWLRQYRDPLREWSEWLALTGATEQYVHREGLHVNAAEELRRKLAPLAKCPAARELQAELVEFVEQQSAPAKPQERLIGSSEVLESVIGKYKRIQSNHSQGGMTSLVLSVGAIVSRRTGEGICQALTETTTQNVLEWCRKHLGTTLPALRQLAFN